MKRAIMCDLDGTLCLYDRSGGKHYERDFENDTINPAVRYVLDGSDQYNEIIFVSGRTDKFRNVTQQWLDAYGFGNHPLFMRKEGDKRKDVEVKREIYNENIKDKYEILFVLDDRDQVVELWRRELGLTCFQVNYGDF